MTNHVIIQKPDTKKSTSQKNVAKYLVTLIIQNIAYLFKGGSIAQKECNAFTFSSDAFAKIGQAIYAKLT